MEACRNKVTAEQYVPSVLSVVDCLGVSADLRRRFERLRLAAFTALGTTTLLGDQLKYEQGLQHLADP